jgi:phosphomannomutase
MAIFDPIEVNYIKIYDNVDNNTGEVIGQIEEEVNEKIGLKEWQKEEIPTARFWLMLKLRNEEVWSEKWSRYIAGVKEFLKSRFRGETAEINNQVERIINKLERSAWNTMPAAFLQQLNIPRAIRR